MNLCSSVAFSLNNIKWTRALGLLIWESPFSYRRVSFIGTRYSLSNNLQHSQICCVFFSNVYSLKFDWVHWLQVCTSEWDLSRRPEEKVKGSLGYRTRVWVSRVRGTRCVKRGWQSRIRRLHFLFYSCRDGSNFLLALSSVLLPGERVLFLFTSTACACDFPELPELLGPARLFQRGGAFRDSPVSNLEPGWASALQWTAAPVRGSQALSQWRET